MKCPKCGGHVQYDGPYCWPLLDSKGEILDWMCEEE